MMAGLYQGFLFLIAIVFNLYLFVLVIRLILAWAQSNYFHPFVQLIVKLTDWLIKPLRRIVPNYGHLETACVVAILGIEMIKFLLLTFLSTGHSSLFGLILLSSADFIKTVLDVFFYAILAQAILSWVQPVAMPFYFFLQQLTAPLMIPLQRKMPMVQGIDFSPLVALILLQLLIIIFVNPLMVWGLMQI